MLASNRAAAIVSPTPTSSPASKVGLPAPGTNQRPGAGVDPNDAVREAVARFSAVMRSPSGERLFLKLRDPGLVDQPSHPVFPANVRSASLLEFPLAVRGADVDRLLADLDSLRAQPGLVVHLTQNNVDGMMRSLLEARSVERLVHWDAYYRHAWASRADRDYFKTARKQQEPVQAALNDSKAAAERLRRITDLHRAFDAKLREASPGAAAVDHALRVIDVCWLFDDGPTFWVGGYPYASKLARNEVDDLLAAFHGVDAVVGDVDEPRARLLLGKLTELEDYLARFSNVLLRDTGWEEISRNREPQKITPAKVRELQTRIGVIKAVLLDRLPPDSQS